MIDESALWLVGGLLLAGMLLAYEIGLRLHSRLRRLADAPGKSESSDEGYVLSGIFGLLALLMAFAFSLALDRYEERRALVVTEANAIVTLDERLGLLGDDGGALRTDLARYAAARVSVGQAAEPSHYRKALAQADALRDHLGADLYAGLRAQPMDARTTLLAQAFDAVGDVATARRAARSARLPGAVLGLLALYCLVGAAILGYTIAASKARHRIASGLFFVLLTAAFIIVLDLDRPRGGTITVPQTELESAAAALVR